MSRLPCSILLAAAMALSPVVARATDEIHWTLTGPTSATFDWRGTDPTLRYGPTSSYGLVATGVTPSPLPFSSAGPFWEARLTGLLPGILYHCSVAGGPDQLFSTLPSAATDFTVDVEGDIGDSATYKRVAAVQSLIAQDAPAFVLANGDLTYGNDDGQQAVDNHFNDVMKWSLRSAYMPAWGNHEWDSSTDDLRNYKGRFDLPNPQTSPGAPSAGCCGEDWYWFDYGQVRFIAYPEPYTGAWSDWNTKAGVLMDQAQSNPAIRYIVTYGHRPAYSSGYHAGDPTLKSYMDALGAAHSKYVLNLNGHSHNYERTYPQSGVTHVTVGIGGSSLEETSGSCLYGGGCPPPSWSAFRAFHHGMLRLQFTKTAIHGSAICGPAGDSGTNLNDITCSPGAVFDAFTIGVDQPPQVTVAAQETDVPGTAVVVPVAASDPDGDAITSLTADLSHLPTDSSPLFTTVSTNTSGQLTWTPTAKDTGSFSVTFRAANALSGTSSTTIRVSASATGVPLGPASDFLAIERIVPNPSRSLPRVVFSSGGDIPVHLDLIDAGGRIVLSRDLANPGAGEHEIALDGGPGLASGIYWLRLTQETLHTSAPIVIVR